MSIPVRDRRERDPGIVVGKRGAFVVLRLPCGAEATLTPGQALTLSAAITTAYNDTIRDPPRVGIS